MARATQRRTLTAALALTATLGVATAVTAPATAAASNSSTGVTITSPVYDFKAQQSPTINVGDTFQVATTPRPGTSITRVEWYFADNSGYYGLYFEPLGVSTTAPFSYTFTGPARRYLGGGLIAIAYDDHGGRTSSNVVSAIVAGGQGRVSSDVRFALPYINEAEWGTARQSVGTQFATTAKDAGTSVFLGYSGVGAEGFTAAGGTVTWPVSFGTSGQGEVAAGTYRLTFRYSNPFGATRSLRLSTAQGNLYGTSQNPVDHGSVAFPQTSQPASQLDWQTVSVDVDLPAGAGTVRLTSPDGTGPLVDYLEVTPVTS